MTMTDNKYFEKNKILMFAAEIDIKLSAIYQFLALQDISNVEQMCSPWASSGLSYGFIQPL